MARFEDFIRNTCLQLPGATENIQWGNDLVFKVAGKMFACMGVGDQSSGYLSLKCSQEEFHELAERTGFRHAPYLARAHWISINLEEAQINLDQLSKLISRSHALVVSKLSKKLQNSLVMQSKIKAAKKKRRAKTKPKK